MALGPLFDSGASWVGRPAGFSSALAVVRAPFDGELRLRGTAQQSRLRAAECGLSIVDPSTVLGLFQRSLRYL